MFRIILAVLACALLTPANVSTQSSPLDAAAKTMGTASLRSLQYTATGQSFVLGQPPTATEPWPLRPVKSYQVYIDYGSNAMRLEQVLTMPAPQPLEMRACATSPMARRSRSQSEGDIRSSRRSTR